MDGTTAIKIDYYEELKAKADKYDELETPKKVLHDEYGWNICPNRCDKLISNRFVKCPTCGQRLAYL